MNNLPSQMYLTLKTQFFTKVLSAQIWYLSRKLKASNYDVDRVLLGCLWSMSKIKSASQDYRVWGVIEQTCQDVCSVYDCETAGRNVRSRRNPRSVHYAARGLF